MGCFEDRKVSEDIRVGSIIVLPKHLRFWVVLDVSQKDIDKGLDVEKPGLYAFAGMWHGTDPADAGSFGKVLPIDGGHVVSHIDNHPCDLIKTKID